MIKNSKLSTKSNTLECYLFNDKNDVNKQIIRKFTTVQKSFYSLAKFGMKPNGIDPQAKAFLYKNFCISKATLSPMP